MLLYCCWLLSSLFWSREVAHPMKKTTVREYENGELVRETITEEDGSDNNHYHPPTVIGPGPATTGLRFHQTAPGTLVNQDTLQFFQGKSLWIEPMTDDDMTLHNDMKWGYDYQ